MEIIGYAEREREGERERDIKHVVQWHHMQ
jgi:hypothetical protein